MGMKKRCRTLLIVLLLLVLFEGCIFGGGPDLHVGVRYSSNQIEHIEIRDEGSVVSLQTVAVGTIRVTVASETEIYAIETGSMLNVEGYRPISLELDKEPAKGEKLTIKAELIKENKVIDEEVIEYVWG